MKKTLYQSFKTLFVIIPLGLNAQILSSNGATIFINNGGELYCNGGVSIANTSSLINEGTVRITKNATNILAGTLTNVSSSTINGNGDYYVEQDWINDATFTANSSSVFLYGNTEQLISSSNGTVTEFNNLICQGNGTGNNRKKTLQNVDSRISATGVLQINDRELATNTNQITVLNNSINAVTNDQTPGVEGFVSSLPNGFMNWNTSTTDSYVFPVGSSDGTMRYRPVAITPTTIDPNIYSVRLNNTIGDTYGYNLSQRDSEIESLNSLFFHSIEQENAVQNASVAIAHSPAQDQLWSNIAQWDFGQDMWISLAPNDNSTLGNYNSIVKADWDFSNPAHPYILVNLVDELSIPNVFTPNQDGANDVYLVSGKGIIEYNIVILNRWGNVVFESNDINSPWDGTSNGNLCKDGVYFYNIKAKSISQEYNEQGHITLNVN